MRKGYSISRFYASNKNELKNIIVFNFEYYNIVDMHYTSCINNNHRKNDGAIGVFHIKYKK